MAKEKTVEETQKSEGYEFVDVPTGSARAIKTPNGDVLDPEQALLEILNEIHKIRKAVA